MADLVKEHLEVIESTYILCLDGLILTLMQKEVSQSVRRWCWDVQGARMKPAVNRNDGLQVGVVEQILFVHCELLGIFLTMM
jgi:hypothetical protein